MEVCESAVRNLTASSLGGVIVLLLYGGGVQAKRQNIGVSVFRRPRHTTLRRVYIQLISQIRLSSRSWFVTLSKPRYGQILTTVLIY